MYERLHLLGKQNIEKALPQYKHICFIVNGKCIQVQEVNKYGPLRKDGSMITYHAEEAALLHNVHPKYREKGPKPKKRYCPLRGY